MKTDGDHAPQPDREAEQSPSQQSTRTTAGEGGESGAALSHFFQRWSQPAKDQSDCLSDAALLAAANEDDHTKWPSHVRECVRCRELRELIADRDKLRVPIQQILSVSSRIANEAAAVSTPISFTPRSYLNAFYNSLAPIQIAVIVVALVVAVFVTSWLYVERAIEPSDGGRIVSLPEDGYWKATLWYRGVNSILEDPKIGAQEKVHQLQPFKKDQAQIIQTINSLGQNLDATQRAELGKLIAACNNQLQILTQSSLMPKNTNDQRPDIPTVAQTVDSKIVTQVWAAFGSPSGPLMSPAPQDMQTAQAIDAASKQTNVASISDKGEIVVHDLLPERSNTDKTQIQERVEQLEKNEGVTVTINWSANRSGMAPFLSKDSKFAKVRERPK